MIEPSESEYIGPTSDAPSEVRQYRNPSLLAGVTAVLGLLSLTALTSTSLWFIPWVTVMLGIIVLRTLARHPEKMGRRPVIVALVLAVFVGTLAPAKLYSRQMWLQTKAKGYAQKWFDLVTNNKLDLAFQLHVPRSQRIERSMSFDQYYQDTPGIKVEYDAFFSGEAVQNVVHHAQTATLTYAGLAGFFPESGFDAITLRYLLKSDDTETTAKTIQIEVVRDAQPIDGVHDWYIGRVEYPPADSPI